MIDTIVVVDTETSDLPENGGALLEVATVSVFREGRKWNIGDTQSWLIAYEGPIAPAAQAAHHITPEMVHPSRHSGPANPDSNVFQRDLVLHGMLAAETPELVYAAHHSQFDEHFLPELKKPWIDTCHCARHMWPDAPSHKNQVLRYYLNLFPPPELIAGLYPHRAQYDAVVTATILQRMLGSRSPEDLLELTAKPVIQSICRFGKHRGERWEHIPVDYLRWMRDKSDMYRDDPEMRATVDHYLSS